jgi:hypothetical protein
MRPLEDMPISQRVLLTVAIVVIVIILLACVGYLAGRWEVEAQPLVPSKWDDHIDMLEKQAIDDAFKRHIGQLYSVWVTDNYQPRIPPKALIGARNARDAYVRSMDAIENRQMPPRAK